MLDVLLDNDHDLYITPDGDIVLTDSPRQAVKIRLLWFFSEFRLMPEFGVPYFEEILVKRPNMERLRRIVRDEVMSVEEVTDVRDIKIAIDSAKRIGKISFAFFVGEDSYKEEIELSFAHGLRLYDE